MFLDTFYELVEKIELHDKIKAKKNLANVSQVLFKSF